MCITVLRSGSPASLHSRSNFSQRGSAILTGNEVIGRTQNPYEQGSSNKHKQSHRHCIVGGSLSFSSQRKQIP